MDFAGVLVPDFPLEMIFRGTMMYLIIFTLLRLVSQRELGETGTTNILLLVLIADAAQNALAGQYASIGDGVILVATIVFWSVALDAIAYRWSWAARIIKPPAILLIDNGKILHRNLRRELMTVAELEAQLREHGITRIDDVAQLRMETDGRVSLITRSDAEDS